MFKVEASGSSLRLKVETISLNSHRSGLVESKIRILVQKLEINEGIELAHVYPTSYGPPTPDR